MHRLDSMDAPIVVAKGADFVAQKIKLIARENDVVMVENRPLARAMYDQVSGCRARKNRHFN